MNGYTNVMFTADSAGQTGPWTGLINTLFIHSTPLTGCQYLSNSDEGFLSIVLRIQHFANSMEPQRISPSIRNEK